MSWDTMQIVIVLFLVTIVFFGMVRELIPPEVLAMGAVALLLAFGVLGINDVLKVFSNTAPFTVGCMFILSAALERTGVIDQMGQALSRVSWRSPVVALATTMLVVMVMSAFMNNTPIVVIMTPVMIALAHSLNVAPSRMLIPLSFATDPRRHLHPDRHVDEHHRRRRRPASGPRTLRHVRDPASRDDHGLRRRRLRDRWSAATSCPTGRPCRTP